MTQEGLVVPLGAHNGDGCGDDKDKEYKAAAASKYLLVRCNFFAGGSVATDGGSFVELTVRPRFAFAMLSCSTVVIFLLFLSA